MYVDCSIAKHPMPGVSLTLHVIYRIMADRTYQACHPRFDAPRTILVYTDSGQGKLLWKESEILLDAGTVFIFSPEEPFYYWPVKEQWNFWWFEFNGNQICPERHLHPVAEKDWIDTLCTRALEAHRSESVTAPAYLSCILALLSESVQEKTDAGKELFSKAQTHMREQLYHTNVASVARKLNVDPRTLYNLFQKYADCAPKDYLKNCVMDRSKYLLMSTTKSISEIAEEMGFSNSFHFSRVFKEVTGTSPSRYRKQKRVTAPEYL